MIHLYGIPNCDTVKKARIWLDGQAIGYTFHDYKKEGAEAGARREIRGAREGRMRSNHSLCNQEWTHVREWGGGGGRER